MDLNLKGRVALVTGSGRGIGRAVVEAFVQEGVSVVVNDIDPMLVERGVESLRASGASVLGVAADICDPASVSDLVKQAVDTFGKVDILVNNAGFTRDKYLTKMPESDWDAVLDVILKGAYLCTKAAVPSMIEQRWGRIINISSRAYLGNPGQTNYSAAKAGLIGFTKALAMEQGKFNITANAIAPGFVETELIKSLPTYEMLKQTALARNPLPRLGTPADIANAVLFLASDRASYITGDVMHVTGGRYSS